MYWNRTPRPRPSFCPLRAGWGKRMIQERRILDVHKFDNACRPLTVPATRDPQRSMGMKAWKLYMILSGIGIFLIIESLWISQHSSLEAARRLEIEETIVEHTLYNESISRNSTQKHGQKDDNHTNDEVSSDFKDYEFREDKLVLTMIALGNATQGTHVHRLIRSARTRGKWTGRIAILTDNTERFRDVTTKDPLVFWLRPRREDWENAPSFNNTKMNMKRFKTFLLDYISKDPRMQDVEFVLYTDIDIVIAKPLVPWLRQKWDKGRENRKQYFPSLSSLYMFSEGKRKGKVAHSGIILLHKDMSQFCLRQWRTLMDEYRDTVARDQSLVRMILRSPTKMNCKIRTWTLNREDLLFPQPKDLEERYFSQFVHVTNTYRAKWIDPKLQKAYFEDVLQVTEEERRDPRSLATIPDNF